MTNLPGWEVKKLEQIANIKGGKRLPKDEKLLNYNTSFAYIRVADFQDNGTINPKNVKFINENTYNILKNYKIYDNNLYISIAGTIGKSGIIPKELNGAILTENAVRLEYTNDNISNRYMYFFTKSSVFKKQVENSTKIVAQPKLAITRLKQIEIPIPPLKEQERIVGILDDSFAKIDESIKILEQDLLNLDELMQSALQKAFNPLKDDTKGNYQLPQGWEWKSLGEICESISAGGDKPKNYTEKKSINNQIPIYANGINNNGLIGYTDKAVIKKPSLTVSARGTIGFVCIRKEPYYPTVRLICAIPNEKILYLKYLYFCLNFFIAKGDGSSIPQLTIPKFKILQIPLPPLKEQEQIASYLDELSLNIKALKENYKIQIKDYEELKKSLLKKAFEGRL
ncbi:restriction endonuclease subunit S [Campylobacter molothri]|uniref:restriction endonuclease subunit S n=1 Tax=Campylobacter molothri TaxID=1032242 RepID=UPI00301DFA1A|nr:restriction endonuclease subunit S [Campylobacter sp. RM9753]